MRRSVIILPQAATTACARLVDLVFTDAVKCTLLPLFIGRLLWLNARAWRGHDQGHAALYTALIVVCSISLSFDVRQLLYRLWRSRLQADRLARRPVVADLPPDVLGYLPEPP